MEQKAKTSQIVQPGDQEQDIYTTASACLDIFDVYLQSPRTTETSRNVTTDLLGRFNLWAAYVGAFAPPKASLDARLASHDDVKGMVIELLVMIQRNIAQEIQVVSESEVKPTQSSGEDPRTTRVIENDQPVSIGFDAVESAIDRLHSLAVAIRRSAARTRDHDNGVNNSIGTDAAEEICYVQTVRRRFPHASEGLVRHVGKSLHIRGKSMYYQQRHNKKTREIRKEPDPKAPQDQPKPYPQGKSVDRPAMTVAQVRRSDHPMSETNASRIDMTELSKRVARMDSTSVISHISRGSSIQESGEESFEYPRRPVKAGAIHGMSPCSLCSEPLKLDGLTDKVWRDHIDRDVQPYICMSGECGNPFRFFDSTRDWRDHMQGMHTLDWAWNVHVTIWTCDIDHSDVPKELDQTEFHDKELLLRHLSEAHSSNLSRFQILARARRAKTVQRREPFTCPFCDCYPDDVVPELSRKPYDLLSRHIARHLKALAFISLSYLDSVDFESEPSDSEDYSNNERTTAARSLPDHDFESIPETVIRGNEAWVEEQCFIQPDILELPVLWPPTQALRTMEDDPILEQFAAEDSRRQLRVAELEESAVRLELEESALRLDAEHAEDSEMADPNEGNPTKTTFDAVSPDHEQPQMTQLGPPSAPQLEPTTESDGAGEREEWHRSLLTSGAEKALLDRQIDDFPFGALKSTTDSYISKKKLASATPAACDQELIDLIFDHARSKGGSMDVAVLACLHVLTHNAGITLIRSLRDKWPKWQFLGFLLFAHEANSLLVRDEHCQVSHILLGQFTDSSMIVHQFTTLCTTILGWEGFENEIFLPAAYVIGILRLKDVNALLETKIWILQAERKYMSLHSVVSLLSNLETLPKESAALEVVSEIVPDWKLWTTWKPNYSLIMQWEGGNFTQSQRERLHPIFDLEGPTRADDGYKRLRDLPERLPDRFKVAVDVLDRMLEVFDKAQRNPGSHAIDLFIHLCVENAEILNHDVLDMAARILHINGQAGVDSVLSWLVAHDKTPIGKLGQLAKLIHLVELHPHLQPKLGHDVTNDAIGVMKEAVVLLLKTTEKVPRANLFQTIYTFGRAIVSHTWTYPYIPADLLKRLQHLPSEEVMQEMLHDLPSPPTPRMLDYLLVLIGGGKDAKTLVNSVHRDMKLWGPSVERARRQLAFNIMGLKDIDVEIGQEQCINQVLVEDLSFIRDLLGVLANKTGMIEKAAMVDLARLLAQEPGRHPCWKFLLCLLMEGGNPDHDAKSGFLAWAAESLPPTRFLEWIQNLRKLFPSEEDNTTVNPALSSLGFIPRNYEWWDMLSNEYEDAVLEVEAFYAKEMGNLSLSWLCLEEFPHITAFLDTLQHKRKGTLQDSSFESFILESFPQPLPQTIRLICTILESYRVDPDLEGHHPFREIQARLENLEIREPKILVLPEQPLPLDSFLREGVCALSSLTGFEISFGGLWSATPEPG